MGTASRYIPVLPSPLIACFSSTATVRFWINLCKWEITFSLFSWAREVCLQIYDINFHWLSVWLSWRCCKGSPVVSEHLLKRCWKRKTFWNELDRDLASTRQVEVSNRYAPWVQERMNLLPLRMMRPEVIDLQYLSTKTTSFAVVKRNDQESITTGGRKSETPHTSYHLTPLGRFFFKEHSTNVNLRFRNRSSSKLQIQAD